jgi:hypothetical protein
MMKLEPVVRLSGNRLAIAYPGSGGVKVIQIQEDKGLGELFDLTPAQLQSMADATWSPDGMTEDDALAIVLTWMSNR